MKIISKITWPQQLSAWNRTFTCHVKFYSMTTRIKAEFRRNRGKFAGPEWDVNCAEMPVGSFPIFYSCVIACRSRRRDSKSDRQNLQIYDNRPNYDPDSFFSGNETEFMPEDVNQVTLHEIHPLKILDKMELNPHWKSIGPKVSRNPCPNCKCFTTISQSRSLCSFW